MAAEKKKELKMKIEIKCRVTGKVLFEHEQEDNTLKITVEFAVKAGADLARADLARADLSYADLSYARLDGARLDGARLVRAILDGAILDGASLNGARLDGARLVRADLSYARLDGASLVSARLDGAYLVRASLVRASLAGASLDGAYLDGEEKLIGKRPIFQIGPIGSRCAYLVSYITDKGLRIRTGCFFGTLAKFKAMLKETHGNNEHAQEYKAALTSINKHYKLWGVENDNS